jgi:hypothetical protein
MASCSPHHLRKEEAPGGVIQGFPTDMLGAPPIRSGKLAIRRGFVCEICHYTPL